MREERLSVVCLEIIGGGLFQEINSRTVEFSPGENAVLERPRARLFRVAFCGQVSAGCRLSPGSGTAVWLTLHRGRWFTSDVGAARRRIFGYELRPNSDPSAFAQAGLLHCAQLKVLHHYKRVRSRGLLIQALVARRCVGFLVLHQWHRAG